VNHGRLIRRLHEHLPDRELLRLVTRYLKAGVVEAGERQASTEGVPPKAPIPIRRRVAAR